MTGDEIGRLFEEAERRFDRAATDAARTDRTIARADDVDGLLLGDRQRLRRVAAHAGDGFAGPLRLGVLEAQRLEHFLAQQLIERLSARALGDPRQERVADAFDLARGAKLRHQLP